MTVWTHTCFAWQPCRRINLIFSLFNSAGSVKSALKDGELGDVNPEAVSVVKKAVQGMGPSTGTFSHPILCPITHPISCKSDRDAILYPTRKTNVYTDASDSASDFLSDSIAPCCPGGKCFLTFDEKFNS
jgi:hypothetical protein